MNYREILTPDNENKKCRKKFSLLRFVFSTTFVVVVLIILQIVIFYCYVTKLYTGLSAQIICIVNCIMSIVLLNCKKTRDSVKVTWLYLFLISPILGPIIYFLVILSGIFFSNTTKLKDIIERSKLFYKNCENDISAMSYVDVDLSEAGFLNYFENYTTFKPYRNTKFKYFDNGYDGFIDIFESIEKAEKFVLIEIFILSDGIIWQELLKLLKKKASEGVEVKLLFDGFNSLASFNKKYCIELKKFGIDAKLFSPIFPFISNDHNLRDHRKLFIIDNKYCYTGGINIADEYANLYERFGVWKDAAIRIEGDAIESFIIMYFQLWYLDLETNKFNISKYLYNIDNSINSNSVNKHCIPYTDCPPLENNISYNIYKYLFSTSCNYVYIMTPYLVVDEGMFDTIESAARHGADIRIIVPHIPDKKYVFFVNRSYYRQLVLAGVKIYEYTKGFIHSKVYLQDDIRAVVGTANLDNRSMYFNYENGVYVYNDSDVISEIKNDFEKTFEESQLMDLATISGEIPIRYKIFGKICKLFAPLM